MENRNVFLFGAGTSFDAGIPLLGNFIDCMLEIALRKKCRETQLRSSDVEIFERAVKVREGLNGYHGRAAFDDRNLEDLLSILSLSSNTGNRTDKARFNEFVNAITRTIDLMCKIERAELSRSQQEAGQGVYGQFWKHVISSAKGGAVPVIISLNYDLVLERSLIATVVGDTWSGYGNQIGYDSLRVKYHCETIDDQVFSIKPVNFPSGNSGYILQSSNLIGKCLDIEILKLHGSLNFPRKRISSEHDFQCSQENPLIMPPVFVKSGERALEPVWARAMSVLRSAINVIVCGYSLPVTDTYMQYFLKSALGPNTDLSKILVFDPILETSAEEAGKMKERYSQVFSQQVKNRISFKPTTGNGTFSALVNEIKKKPGNILFSM